MNPSDPSLSTSPSRPDPRDEALLLDGLRGEVSGRKARALEARLATDPILRAQQARLETFHSLVTGAHDATPDSPNHDPSAAERIARRVRDQVAGEEAPLRREALRPLAGRRRIWGRILAVSVAVHVVLLGVFAVRQHQSRVDEEDRWFTVNLPLPGLPLEDEIWADAPEPHVHGASEWGVPDSPLLPESSLHPSEEEMALAPLEATARDHPRAVGLEMAVRRFDALKRRRLDRYGLDASGTLKAVSRGLARLETRQRPDGSFSGGGGRSQLGQTGLALLPFLAEGDGSGSRDPTGGGREVVGRGIAWVRGYLFEADGRIRASGDDTLDLGLALRALSEDFMVSYGRLPPAAVTRRGEELRRLTDRVVASQRPDGSFPGADMDIRAAVWPMWGLEAAIRTGVVPAPAEVPQRFQRWYATAPRSDPEVAAAGLLLARALGASFAASADDRAAAVVRATEGATLEPFLVAVAGSGLLLHDADTYRMWNDELGDRLLEGLAPTGLVRHGDPVGDTALQLLALQAAYRTY